MLLQALEAAEADRWSLVLPQQGRMGPPQLLLLATGLENADGTGLELLLRTGCCCCCIAPGLVSFPGGTTGTKVFCSKPGETAVGGGDIATAADPAAAVRG